MEIIQATSNDCSESTSSQPPLKRFQLLAQDMMERSSAAAVTVSNIVDTDCLFCWLQELPVLRKTVDLFWVTNTHCWLHLPRTCCHLLHLRHTWNVCFQSVDSWQQARGIRREFLGFS